MNKYYQFGYHKATRYYILDYIVTNFASQTKEEAYSRELEILLEDLICKPKSYYGYTKEAYEMYITETTKRLNSLLEMNILFWEEL